MVLSVVLMVLSLMSDVELFDELLGMCVVFCGLMGVFV